eukprot:7308445-Alexandrium_andersonii.AAC.1
MTADFPCGHRWFEVMWILQTPQGTTRQMRASFGTTLLGPFAQARPRLRLCSRAQQQLNHEVL